MNDDTLPADKLGELGAAHRKSLDMREANRIKAGVLLAAGWAAEQVAEILCADDKAVRNHFEHSRHGGVEALMHAANRSRPSPLSNDSRPRRTFVGWMSEAKSTNARGGLRCARPPYIRHPMRSGYFCIVP